MKVMDVGAGEVGFHIAELLSRERHAVTVIEKDPAHATDVRNKLNALVAEPMPCGASRGGTGKAKNSASTWR